MRLSFSIFIRDRERGEKENVCSSQKGVSGIQTVGQWRGRQHAARSQLPAMSVMGKCRMKRANSTAKCQCCAETHTIHVGGTYGGVCRVLRGGRALGIMLLQGKRRATKYDVVGSRLCSPEMSRYVVVPTAAICEGISAGRQYKSVSPRWFAGGGGGTQAVAACRHPSNRR